MHQASRILARSFLDKDGQADLISRESIACQAWKKAVGKRLAARTTALKLVRDRLVIEVEDEVWRNNLWSLRYQILKNLEKCLGPEIVGDLEFRVMPLRREPQRATAVPFMLDNPLDEADGIADPGLRRNYRRARALAGPGTKKVRVGQSDLPLTDKEVRYVASLANLTLSEEEIARMVQDLGGILEHMDRLSEIDTRDIEPMTQVLFEDALRQDSSTGTLRPDVERAPLGNELAVANAPLSGGGYFKVPKVIER